MRGIFNIDSPFMHFLGKVADLLIADLLWILTSIPIFTIGASTSALYYICFKILKDEEGPVLKTYFKAFKDNFKKSTLIWIIFLAVLVFLAFDFSAASHLSDDGSTLATVLYGLFALFVVLWVLMFVYVFALQARFENSIKKTMLNAIALGIGNLGTSVLMIVADLLLTYLGIRYVPVIVPAVPICFNSFFMLRIFAKYIPAEEAPALPEA